MDVRCERCKTEYEFDDARITEAGVTVKCTTCGHVFKVKKKALVVTVPAQPSDGPGAPLGLTAAAEAKPREWKVRQASGNVFTFKELTTLQKWIVERKVAREDEITLTGETWKRLGGISELSSFFQVVEEAQKATQLSAAQAAAPPAPPPPASAPPPPAPEPIPLASAPEVPPHQGTTVSPSQAPQLTRTNPDFPSVQVPQPAVEVTRFPARAATPEPQAPAAETRPEPVAETPVAPPSPTAVRSAARPGTTRGGGAGRWIVLLVLALLGGGGYWAYSQGHLPFVDDLLVQAKAMLSDVQGGEADPAVAATASDAGTVEAPALDAGAVAEAPVADAGASAAAEAVDAGTTLAEQADEDEGKADAGAVVAAVDAGTGGTTTASAPPPRKRPEPVRDFDYYMAHGDRLRVGNRAQAALEAYAQAAELKPTRAEPHAGRGLAQLDSGALTQAEASFLQALKLNSRYGVAVMGLAETYRAQGKNAEAVRFYRRYLEILPNGPEAPVARSAIERLGN